MTPCKGYSKESWGFRSMTWTNSLKAKRGSSTSASCADVPGTLRFSFPLAAKAISSQVLKTNRHGSPEPPNKISWQKFLQTSLAHLPITSSCPSSIDLSHNVAVTARGSHRRSSSWMAPCCKGIFQSFQKIRFRSGVVQTKRKGCTIETKIIITKKNERCFFKNKQPWSLLKRFFIWEF